MFAALVGAVTVLLLSRVHDRQIRQFHPATPA
jgi:hypothetical protein